jgi:hypothetical protein
LLLLLLLLLNARAVTLESKSSLPQMLLASKAVAEKSMLRPGLPWGEWVVAPDADDEEDDDVKSCSTAACSPWVGGTLRANWTLRAFSRRACRARLRRFGEETDEDCELSDEADDTTVDTLECRRRDDDDVDVDKR